MTTDFKNIVFFALTTTDHGGESICFKHLLEFHPEVRMVDLVYAGPIKCIICEPPIIAEINAEINAALKHWELLNTIYKGKTGDEELTDALQFSLVLIDDRITELKKELDSFGVTT